MKTLHLSIIDNTITLSLWENGHQQGQDCWTDQRDLSTRLLPAIDALLSQHKCTPVDIADFTVEADKNTNFTTPRIAHSVAQAWILAKKYYNNVKSKQ